MKRRKTVLLLIALVLATGSCANLVQVKINVVDQRTALENQVLGSYQKIGGDLLLLASVRSIDSQGRLKPVPKLSDNRKKAIKAMQRSRFNLDDIERFKSAGAIGESNNGYLKYMESFQPRADQRLELFINNLVVEENEDRKTLYLRVVAINENFRENDLPKVEKIMARLNNDSAKPGEWIEHDSGEWIRKGKRN